VAGDECRAAAVTLLIALFVAVPIVIGIVFWSVFLGGVAYVAIFSFFVRGIQFWLGGWNLPYRLVLGEWRRIQEDRAKGMDFGSIRAYPEREESEGDSDGGANMIQAGHWAEASRYGTTLLG
jgi:hypothetical protein